MSETSPLSELASFVGQSRLASHDAAERRLAVNTIARGLAAPRPARKRVSELLGAVLALSARTRRMVLPRVEVDLDVFTPDGRRAVRMRLGAPNP